VIIKAMKLINLGISLSDIFATGLENCQEVLSCSSSRSCRYNDGPLPSQIHIERYQLIIYQPECKR